MNIEVDTKKRKQEIQAQFDQTVKRINILEGQIEQLKKVREQWRGRFQEIEHWEKLEELKKKAKTEKKPKEEKPSADVNKPQ